METQNNEAIFGPIPKRFGDHCSVFEVLSNNILLLTAATEYECVNETLLLSAKHFYTVHL